MFTAVRIRSMGGNAESEAHAMAQRMTGTDGATGRGFFSACYVGNGCAVKVIADVRQDGYLPYLKAVRRLMGTNPHVPKVSDVIVITDGDCHAGVVRMEVLKSATKWVSGGSKDRAGDRMAAKVLGNGHRCPPTRAWMEVFDAIGESGITDDWCYDVHGGNVMFRGTTAVLTDPFSFPLRGA